MCEANAYVLHDGTEELLLESVDKVFPHETEIYLENIFGQRKILAARIKELRLVDHAIILERIGSSL
ncbi:MAG: CooT family nickel-binding protein [Veillonellales bacterium]